MDRAVSEAGTLNRFNFLNFKISDVENIVRVSIENEGFVFNDCITKSWGEKVIAQRLRVHSLLFNSYNSNHVLRNINKTTLSIIQVNIN